MSGWVDLHLHLLPGVDDGVHSLDESVALAKTLVSLGYTEAAPSPHHQAQYASRERCEEQRDALRIRLAAEGISLTLHPNAENQFVDERLAGELQARSMRTIGHSRYVLIEAPYFTPLPSLPQLIFGMQLKGYVPVVAHPERCAHFSQKGEAGNVVAAGAQLQLDVAALIGRYGVEAQARAQRWLDAGLYAVVATDAHRAVDAEAWIAKSLESLLKHVGPKAFDGLLSKTPRRWLNEDLNLEVTATRPLV